MVMLNEYIGKILTAQVYDVAVETPLCLAKGLSKRLHNQVLLKREDLQPVFSFKIRGAYNKIANLSASARAAGVITASAGNHAQGVALAARHVGIKALIVMPKTTPLIKITAVREYGAKIVLHGDTYDEACHHALQLADERALTFVHPYDDPDVIAGQGTIASELLRQHPQPLHAIFVPVGGGGLIAGIATYVKYLRPSIKIIGVEADESPCLYLALQRNERVMLDQVGIFADGVAVRQVGLEAFRIARTHVDEVILADTDEICAAIKDIFDDTRSITEPAGALALAGLKKYVERTGITGANLIAIDSGANINFDRLRHVSERAEIGKHREALLAVTIPERPGSFRAFCQAIGARSITEFNYRYADSRAAHIFVGIELSDGLSERDLLIQHLREHHYAVVDMSDNEMAKLHIRHMVGGHTAGALHEVLYRVAFPERPGALLKFLTQLGERWNISLFHYRNHGAAYGRVLLGLQLQAQDEPHVQTLLDELGYDYEAEGNNAAYDLFLN